MVSSRSCAWSQILVSVSYQLPGSRSLDEPGVALKPDRDFDSHGVYSGSAIEHNGRLYLMYTGNTRDKSWERMPYQCMAQMERWTYTQVLLPGYKRTSVRIYRSLSRPKVWKQKDCFYAVIGAQRSNLTGCAMLYRSIDLYKWEEVGELHTRLSDFGYMWECPDYFEFDDQGFSASVRREQS